MVGGGGTTNYTYTARSRLLTEDGAFTSESATNTYSNRVRLAVSLKQPTGRWTNRFGWDRAGRLTSSERSSSEALLKGSFICYELISDRTLSQLAS